MKKTPNEKRANDYFMAMTKKVSICRIKPSEIDTMLTKTFKQYLNQRYQGNCYYYSTYAVLGLDDDAQLVRGVQTTYGDRRINYPHGWVNFEFEGEDYIFDDQIKGISTKREWDNCFTPEITAQTSRGEILEKFLSDEYSVQVGDNIREVEKHDPNDWNKGPRPLIAIFPHTRFIMSTRGLKKEPEKVLIYRPLYC